MDFLKKHYEKIVLAVTLVALIVSAVLLAMNVGTLSSQLAEEPNYVPAVAPAPHAVLETYSNAVQLLSKPSLWTNEINPFVNTTIPPTPTNTVVVPTNDFQVVLMNVVRKPFKLLFMTYSYDANAGTGYNFQINFQFRSRTFFTRSIGDPIRDRYEDTGYLITKFEKKSKIVDDPLLGSKREKDLSELTVQHEGGNPVVLVLGLESEDQEPVAEVRCHADGAIKEYRRGQSIECDRKTYKVVDITLQQMVIVDAQTQEQHIIKPQQ
jgi:hypothetical protein